MRFGLEVETFHETEWDGCERDDDAENVISESQFFEEYHEDGSLPNGDTEFTTSIFTDDDITDVACEVEELIHPCFETDKSCGIHIHVDQDQFTPASFYELYKFFNSDQYEDYVFNLAGRCDGDHHYGNDFDVIGLADCTDKFQRVAWRTDMKTVEFRIFQSSTEANTIEKYLRSVQSLVRLFCRSHMKAHNLINAIGSHGTYENQELYTILTEGIQCA